MISTSGCSAEFGHADRKMRPADDEQAELLDGMWSPTDVQQEAQGKAYSDLAQFLSTPLLGLACF